MMLLFLLLLKSGIAKAEITTEFVQPTFSSIFSVIISPKCLSCHSQPGFPDLTDYAGVMQYVVAGQPSQSDLYEDVQSGDMPKRGPQLGDDEVSAIGAWITSGALNN